MNCSQCEMVRINGVACHETGCPRAWVDEVRTCKWCGTPFVIEEMGQSFCEDDCRRLYHGLPTIEDEEIAAEEAEWGELDYGDTDDEADAFNAQ